MTKRSQARKSRDRSGLTTGMKEDLEAKTLKVLSKLRPGLSYPQLVQWVNGMSTAERDKMSKVVVEKINAGEV